jgi:protein ImuB
VEHCANHSGRVDRVVVVRCPALTDEDEDGTVLRQFIAVIEAVETFCPWVSVVRAGVCSLPARGPARYFGGEERLVRLIRERVEAATGAPGEVGVADGLFAALLAASAGAVVPEGATPGFLAPLPVGALGNAELADLLVRLGIRTLGAFAALPEPHVVGRFGADGVVCHRVAGGRSGELEGLRDPATGRRVARARGRARVPARAGARGDTAGNDTAGDDIGRGDTGSTDDGERAREVGFWGGASDADERAARSLAAVQSILGPDGVVTARLQGGRTPGERVRFVTWNTGEEGDGRGGGWSGGRNGRTDGIAAGDTAASAPWPGQIPPPAPALVHLSPLPAELVSSGGEPVRVSGRGLLSAPPTRLSVDGNPWEPVAAWAGPWPSDERWWSRSRRRGARLQVVSPAAAEEMAAEVARLLVAERGRWWVEATYG